MSGVTEGTPLADRHRSYGTLSSRTSSQTDDSGLNPLHVRRQGTWPRQFTRSTAKREQWYLAYYIPSLDWIRNYEWSALPGDICSGVTLASFQIPVSLSYATSLANIDAVCGLYGLIVAPIVYALLGSIPVMVVAPEGPISLILGKLSAPYLDGEPLHGRTPLDPEQISAMVAGTAGAVILFCGLLRSGFLTSILAQSLLRGFITGVGVVMISDQLPAMLGISGEMRAELGLDASSFAKARYTMLHWMHAKHYETLFAVASLGGLLAFKVVKKILLRKKYTRAVLIPDILIVVMLATAACKFGKYYEGDDGLKVVGEVNADNVEFTWMLQPKYWKDFKINFQSSFFIGLLGLLESTVAARLLGNVSTSQKRHQTTNDLSEDAGVRGANRELVALGTANVIGSIFGSLPSFGGYGRSKINLLSGGTTQMSAIVSALVTLLCTYKLMWIVYYLPRCTLSAVICTIGINLIEEAPKEIEFFWRVRSYSDLVTMFSSLLVTFFWSVEAGVTVGVGVAFVRVVHHATRPRVQILAEDPATNEFVNAAELEDDDCVADSPILVIKIPEPLTFANSTLLDDMLRRLEKHGTTNVHPGQPRTRQEQVHTVVFHLRGMTGCDASAAATFKEILSMYLKRGIRVVFTEMVSFPELQQMLYRSGIIDMLDSQPYPQSFYPTVGDAIADINSTR